MHGIATSLMSLCAVVLSCVCQLVFEATEYTTAIDTWSIGSVIFMHRSAFRRIGARSRGDGCRGDRLLMKIQDSSLACRVSAQVSFRLPFFSFFCLFLPSFALPSFVV